MIEAYNLTILLLTTCTLATIVSIHWNQCTVHFGPTRTMGMVKVQARLCALSVILGKSRKHYKAYSIHM